MRCQSQANSVKHQLSAASMFMEQHQERECEGRPRIRTEMKEATKATIIRIRRWMKSAGRREGPMNEMSRTAAEQLGALARQ